MKFKFLAAFGAASVLAMAGSASALEIIGVSATAGDTVTQHLITDFNSTGGVLHAGNLGVGLQGGTIDDLAAGFTFTQDVNAYTRDGVAGLDSGVSAPPPLDNGVAGAYYETVLSGGSATLTSLRGLSSFSFYMGSPDDYNHASFTFYGAGGSQTLNGTAIWGGTPPGNGDQSEGFTVTYTFAPDAVRSIEFTSTGNSFEFDKLAGTEVPEPATWSMMIMGFGLAGGMMRAARRKQALA